MVIGELQQTREFSIHVVDERALGRMRADVAGVQVQMNCGAYDVIMVTHSIFWLRHIVSVEQPMLRIEHEEIGHVVVVIEIDRIARHRMIAHIVVAY